MFFELSKTAGAFLVNPGNLFVLVLLLGAVLLWTPARRLGRGLVTLAVLLGLFAATVPAGRSALLALENRFPAVRELPARVDEVVVLGGMVDPFLKRASAAALC